jgi:hypothetical protein
MDEGAADLARASNVRVEIKYVSAAQGRPGEYAGRWAAAGTPAQERRISGKTCLMQRQPRRPAYAPA